MLELQCTQLYCFCTVIVDNDSILVNLVNLVYESVFPLMKELKRNVYLEQIVALILQFF